MREDVSKKIKEEIVGISDVAVESSVLRETSDSFISTQGMKLSEKGNENEFPLAFPNIFKTHSYFDRLVSV